MIIYSPYLNQVNVKNVCEIFEGCKCFCPNKNKTSFKRLFLSLEINPENFSTNQFQVANLKDLPLALQQSNMKSTEEEDYLQRSKKKNVHFIEEDDIVMILTGGGAYEQPPQNGNNINQNSDRGGL